MVKEKIAEENNQENEIINSSYLPAKHTKISSENISEKIGSTHISIQLTYY